MGTTSKSPKRILQAAHAIGQRRLPAYSHRFSPKKFTLPQLFACLVLKEFLRLDYRKLSALLEDAPSFAAAIGLKSVPHFSTFQKAADRLLLAQHARRLLDETVEVAQRVGVLKKTVALAALDGTGFETRHITAYFVKRREKGCKTSYQTTTYTRYPYANIVCACRSHFVLAIVTGRGPGPDDPYFQPALRQTVRRIRVTTLLADAGFDSERAHMFARQECGIRAIIPATRGRPTTKPLRGYWRNKMKQRFPKRQYGQRWQVETVHSMIKRVLGAALRARSYWSQSREIILKALTLNVMILRCGKVFDRAGQNYLFEENKAGWESFTFDIDFRPPLLFPTHPRQPI
jgi:DDE family transposase